jgi:hypothetical protein
VPIKNSNEPIDRLEYKYDFDMEKATSSESAIEEIDIQGIINHLFHEQFFLKFIIFSEDFSVCMICHSFYNKMMPIQTKEVQYF